MADGRAGTCTAGGKGRRTEAPSAGFVNCNHHPRVTIMNLPFPMFSLRRGVAAALAAAALSCLSRAEPAAPVPSQIGATRVATWQDDRKAAFMLMFDDSWPSHWQVAVPALVERKMTATFYINPGKGEYSKFKAKWENEIWKTGVVYGDHTMTHQGVKDMANAEVEIGECAKLIAATGTGRNPRLISWAMPGVGPGKWNISTAELQTLLDKYHLIDRPPFANHGVVYHLKTPEQMLALADKAIQSGGMEYLIAHGVERGPDMNWGYQDFWAWKQDSFKAVLDGLAERRDRGDLWITDHISYHQYLTERNSAKVQTVQAGADVIKLDLTCAADPKFYDHPLTLLTRVPAGWRQCEVVQGGRTVAVTPVNGVVRFDAIPNGEPIVLHPRR